MTKLTIRDRKVSCWVFKRMNVLLTASFVSLLWACAGSDKKESSSGPVAEKSSERESKPRRQKEESVSLPDPVSSDVVKYGSTLIKSVGNNRLTSRVVRAQKAQNLAQSLGQNNVRDLIDAVAAERISGTGATQALERGEKLMDHLFKSGIDKDLPDSTKLELGLAATQDSNYALATLFLRPLFKSKNRKIQAGAHNAMGVLNLKMNKVPDAVLEFKNALKASPNYPATLYNYGILAAKYGDFSLARKYLGSLQRDWYAQVALVTVERQLGRTRLAENLCKRLIRQKPNHKIALYNCGLFYAQNKNQIPKGREMISKATQKPGGEMDWDEKAFRVLEGMN